MGRLAGNSESDLSTFLKKFAKLDAGKSDSILVGSLKDHKTWGKETFSEDCYTAELDRVSKKKYFFRTVHRQLHTL